MDSWKTHRPQKRILLYPVQLLPHMQGISIPARLLPVPMRVLYLPTTNSHVLFCLVHHRVPFRGLAASSASQFATPLGLIPLDTEEINTLVNLPQVQILDDAHLYEHSLEVHLPFLQTVLDEFTLIPLVVGDTDPDEVAQVLEHFINDEHTLIVISSDLSHYLDYHTAQQRDRATSQAIEQLKPEDIGYEDACGRNPVKGLLRLAKQLHLKAEIVDLRNSGDTAGPRDQVVGYGAYIIH